MIKGINGIGKLGIITQPPFSKNNQHSNMVLRYSAKGKTNQDADRDVLKDLSGNGHDLKLYNFGFQEMSGYGGYIKSITNTNINPLYAKLINNNICLVTSISKNIGISAIQFIIGDFKIGDIIKFRIKGLKDGQSFAFGINNIDWLTIDKDGDYQYNVSRDYYIGIRSLGYPEDINTNFTFELIPQYPDGLVFDGIDDYALCDSQIILEQFTVIIKRKILNKEVGAIASKTDPVVNTRIFLFEYLNNKSVQSFGETSYINIETKDISVLKTNMYNQTTIKIGNLIDDIKHLIYIGTDRYPYGKYSNIVLYDFVLYNRTLSEQEIQNEIKKYNL